MTIPLKKYTAKRYCLAIIYLLCLAASKKDVLPPPIDRADLTSLGAKTCTSKPSLSLNLKELWKAGYYDAQIEINLLTPKKKITFPNLELHKLAKLSANKHHHFGFKVGKCYKSNKIWLITTPSPSPYLKVDKESIQLDFEKIAPYCQKVRIDYAEDEIEKPRKLFSEKNVIDQKNIKVALKYLNPGVVSVTCTPKLPKWLGPQLWFLFPVKGGPSQYVPFSEILDEKQKNQQDPLVAWINKLRQTKKLPTLNYDQASLKEIATKALKNKYIKHDRRSLRKINAFLKRNKGRLIGENRVKGDSHQKMAWLLWNSPRHRSLLLNSKATHLTIIRDSLKNEKIAILVFAKF